MQTSELKPTQKLVLSRVCRMCCCSGCLNATDIFEQTARQLQWRKVKVMHRRPYSTVTFDEKNIPTQSVQSVQSIQFNSSLAFKL